MKIIQAIAQYCMNCRLCEINCMVAHSSSRDIITAFRAERERLTSRVTVEQSGPRTFPVQCRFCQDAPCAVACMTGAITQDPATGWVAHDPDKCVGCWMCVMVCPNGAMARDVGGHVTSKCDLCAALDQPACVAGCPNGALVLAERDEVENA